MAAHRLHGKPAEWRWFSLNSGDAPEGFVKVVGAVPVGTYRSGKRKGRPKWPKDGETLWIKRDDFTAMQAAWESETGKCAGCCGAGGTIKRASIDGAEYQECRVCCGTGEAKKECA
jgi:hypothetical protein